MPTKKLTHAQIRPVKQRIEDELLSRPGVVGVDINEKVSDGKPTGELAIVVYVEKKKPKSQLSADEAIPTRRSSCIMPRSGLTRSCRSSMPPNTRRYTVESAWVHAVRCTSTRLMSPPPAITSSPARLGPSLRTGRQRWPWRSRIFMWRASTVAGRLATPNVSSPAWMAVPVQPTPLAR